jgi:hypothetical protein
MTTQAISRAHYASTKSPAHDSRIIDRDVITERLHANSHRRGRQFVGRGPHEWQPDPVTGVGTRSGWSPPAYSVVCHEPVRLWTGHHWTGWPNVGPRGRGPTGRRLGQPFSGVRVKGRLRLVHTTARIHATRDLAWVAKQPSRGRVRGQVWSRARPMLTST